jgi:hypothetical protein
VTVTNLVARPGSAPTGLIATPGVGQVVLDWQRVPGATGYQVKRADISGGCYEVIAPTLAATNYLDRGLIPGTPYYYLLSAVNSGGAGPDSVEVSATPIAPALSILLQDRAARLSWPDSAAGFALQETAVLADGWRISAASFQVQGTDEVAVVQVAAPARFYRLIR